MGQIFVSYKHEPQTVSFVKQLKQKLEDAHFDVWIDSELLQPGQDWKKEIDNAIKASIALIAIMTPEAFQSQYVTYEWAFGIGRGMEVIPLMLVITELHPRLNDLQFIDFSNHFDQPWDKLIRRLEVIETGITSISREIPPFVKKAVDALDSYEEEDREEAIKRLMKSNHPAATEALAQSVMHHLNDVRVNGAITLAEKTKCKDVRCLPGLIEGIKTRKKNTCIRLLGAVGTPEAVQFLFDFIGKLPPGSNDNVFDEAFNNITNVEAFTTLIEHTNDDNPVCRSLAFIGLATLKVPESVPVLIKALDDFVGTSITVAKALGDMRDSQAVPALARMLSYTLDASNYYERNFVIRCHKSAAEALGKIADPDSIRALLSALDNEIFTSVKAIIIESLGIIGGPSVIDPIKKFLVDQSQIDSHELDFFLEERFQWKTISDIAEKALTNINTPEALAVVEKWKTEQKVE